MKRVHIIGGGTVHHIAPHLALAAPAYGGTARQLNTLCIDAFAPLMSVSLHMTKMAGGSKWETNEDIDGLLELLTHDFDTKVIFMSAALCDYSTLTGVEQGGRGGKYGKRYLTREEPEVTLYLQAERKLIGKIRKNRKDIFVVGFKTTAGATADEMYLAGLALCKSAHVNLVLANDVVTRVNMIITPEEARYCVTQDRDAVLKELVAMTKLRSHLTFTRSRVVAGQPVPWGSRSVPTALREVVDFCIKRNAYKPFRGSTVGHFACKLDEKIFLTSIRRSNFNDLEKTGLVRIETDGPDSVLAYGAKPSVGGQSQRIVFGKHPEYDCIVHFHCPIRPGSQVPTISQREYECGSHECGQNTANGLRQFGNLSAVYLQEHGPNIVFHSSIDPQEVICFIDENFDLSLKTGGSVTE